MAGILWVGACAAAVGVTFAVAVVAWPSARRGPSVWDIQRRLDAEERGSK